MDNHGSDDWLTDDDEDDGVWRLNLDELMVIMRCSVYEFLRFKP